MKISFGRHLVQRTVLLRGIKLKDEFTFFKLQSPLVREREKGVGKFDNSFSEATF
jgi:hypothetical protein